METLTYAATWSEKWPTEFEELDEDEARRRHESGELYSVVLGDPESADAYLQIRLEVGYVSVHFLDEQGRDYVTYVFGKKDGDDRLFLEQATWREFGESRNVRLGETYYFDRDGTVHLQREDFENREATRGEKKDDVSGNWEPVPEFGRYDSIARLDR